jgi:hypothetical protein
MYAHSFLVTSVRGIGFAPTTSARVLLGVTGRMKAAFGLRALFFFGAAAFFTGLFAAAFFLGAAFFFAVFAMHSPQMTLVSRVAREYHGTSRQYSSLSALPEEKSAFYL